MLISVCLFGFSRILSFHLFTTVVLVKARKTLSMARWREVTENSQAPGLQAIALDSANFFDYTFGKRLPGNVSCSIL
jgi:hypothetical protein